MDRPIGSSEAARTAREVVLVDAITGAPVTLEGAGTAASQVQGAAAANAAMTGNPVLTGGRAGSSQTIYDHNDLAPLEQGTRGHLMIGGEQFTQTAGASMTACAVADRLGAGRVLATVSYLNNGVSLDQRRKPNSGARLIASAATTNAAVVKSSAGDLNRIVGRNQSAAVLFLKLYNKASAPSVGSDTPVLTLPLPPEANFAFDLGTHYFSTGIGMAITAGAADADTAAVGAGDVICLNLTYA